ASLGRAPAHTTPPRRLAPPRHDDPVMVAHRQNGRAVHRLEDLGGRRRAEARHQVRRLAAEQIHEARARVVVEQRAPPSLVHRHIPEAREMLRKRSAAVGDSVRSWRTCASVPRSGSSMKIFLRGPSLRSKITESQLAETISSAWGCRHMPPKYARVSF